MKVKLILNTFSSIFYQLVVIICGFILPKVILSAFGSEINGLVNSITQFISIVSLLELGVGAVISSNLYKPLAEKNWNLVSKILASAEHFFKNIGKILACYIFILIFIFPLISNNDFDFLYTSSLILIIGVNSFAQYYIGIVDKILLNSDQLSFIQYFSQTVAHLSNCILCILFINMGFGIHVVRFITAIVYFLRPIIVRIYINNHYKNIDRNVSIQPGLIKQKWNGLAQHISECILDSTDTIVLTVFSSLTSVSIYSVYNMVVYNLKQFFLISTTGVLALEGNLLARNEKEKLDYLFTYTEWFIHVAVVFVFGCTLVLLVPFISVYTQGLTDANYIQPLFSMLIVLAHAIHCLRLPYFTLIRASGQYKQTQVCFIATALLNIIISCVLVIDIGLVGVAIGTLISMAIQTLWLSHYCYSNIIKKSYKYVLKLFFADAVCIILIMYFSNYVRMSNISYLSWIHLSIKNALISLLVIIIINSILFKDNLKRFIKKVYMTVKKMFCKINETR